MRLLITIKKISISKRERDLDEIEVEKAQPRSG